MNENDNMPNDPSHWKSGIFYFNPKDKRVFVPKRLPGFGFTLNFANPYSILILGAIIIFAVFIGNK